VNPVDLARKRWKPVRKALEERERLEAELTAAGARLSALQDERQEAAQDDREAYAAAIAAGQDEPVRKVEQLAIRIEAEQRRVDACVLAVERASAELDRLRAVNRSVWHKDTLAKIAEAHGAYEESIRLLEQRREALADEVALAGWVSDGIGVSPIRDPLSGRDREALSFARVLRELEEDATNIATHLREIEPSSPWSLMRRAEALVGKGTTREQALKQVGYWDEGA
jgi:DNA repair exonuclease SbcCD ATPase subunit